MAVNGENLKMKNLRNGKSQRRYNNQRGAILITTLIIFSFLAVLGMNLIVYMLARMTNSTLELDRLKALYLAEAAIASSLYELRSNLDRDNNGLGNVLRKELGDGTIKASHNFQLSTITGTGQYNGVTRRVQVRYSSL